MFYESGLSVNVLYTLELESFKFALQKSKLAGTIRGSYFVIKGEYSSRFPAVRSDATRRIGLLKRAPVAARWDLDSADAPWDRTVRTLMAHTGQRKTLEPAPEEEQQPVAPEATAAPRGLSPPAVLSMQRSGGNQMVQRVLSVARQTATASKIDQLDEMLDRFDVPEDDVIALLGTLSVAEKTTVLTGGYKDKIADALDTGEMVRAVNNLDAALSVKLDWVSAAAGGAGDIDYAEIKAMIVAAPQDQRNVLKSTPWRDFFVDVCTNATMPEAVGGVTFRR